jgi:hypothetical protein
VCIRCRSVATLDACKANGLTLVLIDTLPHVEAPCREAAKLADFVIIPCGPTAPVLQRPARLCTASGENPHPTPPNRFYTGSLSFLHILKHLLGLCELCAIPQGCASVLCGSHQAVHQTAQI